MELTTLQLWPKQAYEIIKEKNISIKELEFQFPDILFPWNDRYDQQRQLFSSQIQEKPLFIIKLNSEEEIISLYELISNYRLTIQIVGGRHSTAFQNPDIFADMSNFNKIILLDDLIVGGGVTQGQVNKYLFGISDQYHFIGAKPNRPHSLAFPGGSAEIPTVISCKEIAASVGCAGISTCAGVGTLRRTLGLTIDSIKEYRIVVPPSCDRKAKVVNASEKEHRNLLGIKRWRGSQLWIYYSDNL